MYKPHTDGCSLPRTQQDGGVKQLGWAESAAELAAHNGDGRTSEGLGVCLRLDACGCYQCSNEVLIEMYPTCSGLDAELEKISGVQICVRFPVVSGCEIIASAFKIS